MTDAPRLQWLDMRDAPRDGTVIIAMARFRSATAGSPSFVHFLAGEWRLLGRSMMEPMVCWAWMPRDILGPWPEEPNGFFDRVRRAWDCYCEISDSYILTHSGIA